jgi:hypothetical protein
MLTAMPMTFTAGESVIYKRTDSDYSAVDWDLHVYVAGATQFNVASVASGSDFLVTIPASVTAGLTPGYYRFQEIVIQRVLPAGQAELEKHLIGSGPISVEMNLATASAGSGQSFEEKVLAALEAKISGRVTVDQETLQIDGTAIARIPFEKLFELRQKFATLVDLQRSPNASMGSVEVNFGQPSLPTLPGFPLPPTGGNW